jgi:hypothetical protein
MARDGIRGQVLQSTLSRASLYLLEPSAHHGVTDSQVHGDLLQPISMLSIRLDDPGFLISSQRSVPISARLALAALVESS